MNFYYILFLQLFLFQNQQIIKIFQKYEKEYSNFKKCFYHFKKLYFFQIELK